MRKRLARLFTIMTRFEAYLVTYAVAVGAVERGQHYMQMYPGKIGWVFALLCTGVVFLVGGKLLDSVRPASVLANVSAGSLAPKMAPRHRRISRTRPRFARSADSRSRAAPRKD